jgi:hypothetical protein
MASKDPTSHARVIDIGLAEFRLSAVLGPILYRTVRAFR